MSAPEKGSKVNTQTLENCFGVIIFVEDDITSRGDVKLFFLRCPLGNCKAVTAGGLI